MKEFLYEFWLLIQPYLPTLIGAGGIIGTALAALKRCQQAVSSFMKTDEVGALLKEIDQLKKDNAVMHGDNRQLKKEIADLIETLSKVEYKLPKE